MPAEWTTPITWNVDQLVTNTDLNAQVRDNLEYLLSPNHERILLDSGGNYSLSNVQTFQDIDATELSIDLETHGGPVWVHFQAVVHTPDPTDRLFFDFTVDGSRVATAFTAGLVMVGTGDSNYRLPLTMSILLTGLSAGTYTLRPQWRSSAGGGGSIVNGSATNPILFEVIEL